MVKRLALLLFTAIPLNAQSNTVNRALLGVDMGLRTTDGIETYNFLHHPCKCFHEGDPIAPGSGNPLGIMAFQGGAFLGVRYGSRLLERHGHRRWARVLILTDIAVEAYTVQDNLRLKVPK